MLQLSMGVHDDGIKQCQTDTRASTITLSKCLIEIHL